MSSGCERVGFEARYVAVRDVDIYNGRWNVEWLGSWCWGRMEMDAQHYGLERVQQMPTRGITEVVVTWYEL